MNARFGLTVFALVAATGFVAPTAGQVTPRFDTLEIAAEVPAGRVRLPSGPDSSLLMPPCGDCPPKSFRITPATAYFIGSDRVTLAALAEAVRGRPDAPLTVAYSVKTSEVTSVTADIVSAARRR